MTAVRPERVAVRNASDPKQVKQAAESDKLRGDREIADLLAVLDTPVGRRVLERILSQCHVFGSIMQRQGEPGAAIHYRAGQQDVGHWLLAEIGKADPKAFLVMMSEKAKLDDFILPIPPSEEESE